MAKLHLAALLAVAAASAAAAAASAAAAFSGLNTERSESQPAAWSENIPARMPMPP